MAPTDLVNFMKSSVKPSDRFQDSVASGWSPEAELLNVALGSKHPKDVDWNIFALDTELILFLDSSTIPLAFAWLLELSIGNTEIAWKVAFLVDKSIRETGSAEYIRLFGLNYLEQGLALVNRL